MAAHLGVATERGKCIVAIAGDTYVLIQVVQIVPAFQALAAIQVQRVHLLILPESLGTHALPVALTVANGIIQLLRVIFRVAADQVDTRLLAVIEKQLVELAHLVI